MAKKLTAVRIKEHDVAVLEKLAVKKDETVSSLIRIAVEQYVERETKKGKK